MLSKYVNSCNIRYFDNDDSDNKINKLIVNHFENYELWRNLTQYQPVVGQLTNILSGLLRLYVYSTFIPNSFFVNFSKKLVLHLGIFFKMFLTYLNLFCEHF